METNRPVYVVRLLLVCLATVSLFSCYADQKTPEESNNAQKSVSVSEAQEAASIPVSSMKIDSFAYRIKAGDRFTYKATQETHNIATEEESHQKIVQVYTERYIGKRDDGSFDVGLKIDSMYQTIDVRNPKTGEVLLRQDFSSADTADMKDPMLLHLATLIGEEVTVNIGPDGILRGIVGVNSIVDKIIKKAPQFPVERKDQFAKELEAGIFASLIGREHIDYPKNRSDSLYSWELNADSPLSGLLTLSTKSQYKVVEFKKVRDVTLAVIKGTIEGAISNTLLDPQAPIEVKIVRSSLNGTSTALLDVERGTTVMKAYKIEMSAVATTKDKKTNEKRDLSIINNMSFNVELIK